MCYQAYQCQIQKKSNDIVAAYKMVSDVQKELAEMRSDEAFQSSYRIAIETAQSVVVEPSVPHVVSRQQHRSNIPRSSPEDYYRCSVLFLC